MKALVKKWVLLIEVILKHNLYNLIFVASGSKDVQMHRDMINGFLKRSDDNQQQKMQSIDNKREIKEEEFEGNYPFTPAISNNTRRINGIKNDEPIYVRYPKELEKKK